MDPFDETSLRARIRRSLDRPGVWASLMIFGAVAIGLLAAEPLVDMELGVVPPIGLGQSIGLALVVVILVLT